MAAAYEVEYSPLIHKLLKMIPLIIKARKSFPKEHEQYKSLDDMVDKLLDKLGKIIFSPEKQHVPLLFENVVPCKEDDLPDVYAPTESETNFDAYSYLKTMISGPMNESLEQTEKDEKKEKEKKEKKEREAKKQEEVDELMERWNA
jgi:hypothetical protein